MLGFLMVVATVGAVRAETSFPTKTVRAADDGELENSWQVRTHDKSVRIRLYAIDSEGREVLLTEQKTPRGNHRYGFVDTKTRRSPAIRYRLCAARSNGRETTLAEIRCVIPEFEMEGSGGSIVTSPEPACDASRNQLLPPEGSNTSPAMEFAFDGERPAPQVPPPRALA